MHCGLLASHASTLSTGAFDAPGSASKFSRLLPTCPKQTNARSNPRGVHRASRWAGASHLRVVQLGIGAVRLHRRRGAAGQVGRRLEAGLCTRRRG